jgi:hypothetical protein
MSPVHISGTIEFGTKVPNNKGGSVNHTVYNTHSHLELRLDIPGAKLSKHHHQKIDRYGLILNK